MSFFKHNNRIRRGRRSLRLPLITLAFLAVLAVLLMLPKPEQDKASILAVGGEQTPQPVHSLQTDQQVYTVMKKTVFICGEEVTELGSLKGADLHRMLQDNEHLLLKWGPNGTAVLLEYIEDFQPNCKDNAYFGLDQHGNLSLFEGPPEHEKVIRTFFQIDIQHLESSLPREAVKQLYGGIKVIDFSSYNSVLSTFADFAVDRYAD